MKITYIGLIILLSGISINTKGQNTNHHFIFDQFRKATVLYKNQKRTHATLNYNKATEEMIYTSQEGKNMALYPIDQIDTIYFDKRKFIPVDNRFYEVLTQDRYTLYASYRCRMSVRAQNIGYGTSSTTAIDNISSLNTSGERYQLKLPENYKAEPYVWYYIEIANELNKFSKAKELIKLFPDLKKEITSFIKENRIKNSTQDIVEVVQYITDL